MTLKPTFPMVFALLLTAPAMADDSVQGTAELQKCKICHSFDKAGPNRVGPNLYGVFGRKAGMAAGFNYSDAMKNSGIVWDDDSLAKFLQGPQEAMPGNHMSCPGIKDEAALTGLLKQLKQATQ
jgi:cytochrome c